MQMKLIKEQQPALFHDIMHKEVEVYVDDMMVKSEIREGHFEALDKFLARLEKYNLRLNPKKCVFGVTSGKLLGHIVSKKGIDQIRIPTCFQFHWHCH